MNERKSFKEMANECGLILIDTVPDPALFVLHFYAVPKEGEWGNKGQRFVDEVFETRHWDCDVSNGFKHPDLYNFSAVPVKKWTDLNQFRVTEKDKQIEKEINDTAKKEFKVIEIVVGRD